MFNTEQLQEKWQPVLEHKNLPKIDDAYRRAVTSLILENQEKAIKEDNKFLSENGGFFGHASGERLYKIFLSMKNEKKKKRKTL